MGTNPKLIALYRVAEKNNKNNKEKLDYIDNEVCLRNFRKYFKGELHVFGDRLDETKEVAQEVADHYHEIESHGNAESLNEVIQFAITWFGRGDMIYLVEDDYLHRGNVDKAIIEGLSKVDYVTLYDHPDKNMQWVQTFNTDSFIWKMVQSTTMTFATKYETLRNDYNTMKPFIRTGNPSDHYMFLSLNRSRYRLASIAPGLSTHTETKWLSPTINWKAYV